MSIESAKLNAERAAWKALVGYSKQYALANNHGPYQELMALMPNEARELIQVVISAYHTALENAAAVN